MKGRVDEVGWVEVELSFSTASVRLVHFCACLEAAAAAAAAIGSVGFHF